MTLRPAAQRLRALADRVSGVLIPELEALGHRFAAQSLSEVEDASLAEALSARLQAVEHWRRVYRDEFIPFAHGVRQLAMYYNDWVQPEDAYQFVGLLRGENLAGHSVALEQRLLLIARALIKLPKILVLDEPTHGLDDTNRARLLDFLEMVVDRQISTIIYVSHRGDEFRSFFRQHLSFESLPDR